MLLKSHKRITKFRLIKSVVSKPKGQDFMTTLTGTENSMGEIKNSLDFFENLRKDAYGKEESYIETIINV